MLKDSPQDFDLVEYTTSMSEQNAMSRARSHCRFQLNLCHLAHSLSNDPTR